MQAAATPGARVAAPRAGFGLVWVALVLALGAIALGVALPALEQRADAGAEQSSARRLAALAEATRDYFRDTRALPSSAAALVQDPGAPAWSGPYLSEASLDASGARPLALFDGWQHAFAPRSEGESLVRWSSAGRDGVSGTSDDPELAVELTSVRRELTLLQLDALNRSVARWRAAHPATPLSGSLAAALATLVAAGYLPSAADFQSDAWGSALVPVEEAAGTTSFTSAHCAANPVY